MSEIDTIREALVSKLMTNGFGEKAKRLMLVLPDGSDGGGYCESAVNEMIKAALSAIDPDAIRRECADRAWDWFCGKSKIDNFPAKKEDLSAAIIGTEPARDGKTENSQGCFRCRNRPALTGIRDLCDSCRLVIGRNYDPMPIGAEPARKERNSE